MREKKAIEEKETGGAVNEWDMVVDVLQFKQAILTSLVQVDKSVSGAARLHRSRLL